MKKIIFFTTLLLSVVLLTGCNKVEVVPDSINVVFEKARFEDGSLYVETHITNGFDKDVYVGYMEFGIQIKVSEVPVAYAGFDININIEDGEYISIELEFTVDFMFVTEEELGSLGFTLDDLELYFLLT